MVKKALRVIFAVFITVITLETAILNVFAGNDVIILNNEKQIFNAPQKVINGISCAPIKPILEAMGWKLIWDSSNKSISCTKDNRLFVFKVGSDVVNADDEQIILETPVIVSNGITYIPCRFIAQEFGNQIKWNGKDNLIILSGYEKEKIFLEGEKNIVIAGSGIIVNIFEPYGKDTISDMAGYADRLLGKNSAGNALEKYKEILHSINPDDNPEIYTHILINTSNCYILLAQTKNVRENLMQSINLYEKVLKVYKDNITVDSYACVLNNLGNAYRMLFALTGNRNDIEKTVSLYMEALEYRTASGSLQDSALIRYNLGLAYNELEMKDKSHANLMESANLYKRALADYSIQDNPAFYALIQYHLGNIYRIISGDEENLKYSKAAYEEALKVWSVESYPMNYARVHKCLGDVYNRMYPADGNKENLTRALEEYRESLKFFSIKTYPFDYAKVNIRMGDTYLMLDGEKYLKESFCAYKEAMKAYNPFGFAENTGLGMANMARFASNVLYLRKLDS